MTLSESELADNLADLRAVNNRNGHPSQKDFARFQSYRSFTAPEFEGAHSAQPTVDPPRPIPRPNQAMPPSPHMEPQEVTQKCPVLDCWWTSYKSTDSTHLDACIQMLKIHIQLVHGTTAHMEPQEVTQKCPVFDCRWTYYKSTDSTHLDACVQMLKIHIQ